MRTTKRRIALPILFVFAMAGLVQAEAPETALRPEARPGSESAQALTEATRPIRRPAARPVIPDPTTAASEATDPVAADSASPATIEATVGATAGAAAVPAAPDPAGAATRSSEASTPATVAATEVPALPATVTGITAPQVPPDARSNDIALPRIDTGIGATRQSPALSVTVDAPDMVGPRQMIMAELLMTAPPPPLVFQDAWDRQSPPPRPGSGVAPARTATTQSAILRPESRPETMPALPPPVLTQLRPRARPAAPVDPQPMIPATADTPPAYAPGAQPGQRPEGPGYSEYAVARAFRPPARPQNVSVRAETQRTEQVRGQVCGTPDIQGEVVSAIRDGGGCGIEEPVRIRSVSGVRLSSPALMDCNTALALNRWLVSGAMPAVGTHGGGISSLNIMGHYACRPRNNQAGQRLSEHGKGHAIDIGGIGLRNGTEISVLSGWNRQGDGAILRQMHRAACGTFGTVLGPDANRFHANHFHFDTAANRNNSYCR
jgi:hypothetical protein